MSRRRKYAFGGGRKAGRRRGRRLVTRRPLFPEPLERRVLLTAVTTVTPSPHANAGAISTNVNVVFDQSIDGTSVSAQTLAVHSMWRGQLVGPGVTLGASGSIVVANPTADFMPGEAVQASVTGGIQSVSLDPADPFVWQWRTAVSFGSGLFSDDGQTLGNHSTRSVAVGDLDGDGDLDAFTANFAQGNRVWLNSGGVFSDSGQSLGASSSFAVALGDLDGDGDLDAFVGNSGFGGEANHVWFNNGSGVFTDSGQDLGNSLSRGVALADLDGDGDLDGFVSNSAGGSHVWQNNGNGNFSDVGQNIGSSNAFGVSLGDLDGDGDTDALIANVNQPNRIWLNANGVFSDSGQLMGDHSSRDVALGDLDGDGDLDAFVANSSGDGDRVWQNDGNGVLSDTGQDLGRDLDEAVQLGDLDGDGDLDAFTAGRTANRVWRNEGGVFTNAGQSLGNHGSYGVGLGDFDGDGDLDAITANSLGGANRVWRNTGPVHSLAANHAQQGEGNSGARDFLFTVSREFESRGVTTIDYEVTPSGPAPASAADFVGGAFPSGTLTFQDGEDNRTLTVSVAGDTLAENDETFTVKDLTPPGGVNQTRITLRREALKTIDTFQRQAAKQPPALGALDDYYHSAFRMITSPATQRAFDLSREPDALRDAYGRNKFGQSCLLARRLIEAGTRFVTVSNADWDTHRDNFTRLKTLLPPLDQAFPALLVDLEQRGLLDKTLVVWLTDFGRTPTVNVSSGRDHWASAGIACFAGAGVPGGTVVGQTDAIGGHSIGEENYPQDIAATVYTKLGIPLETTHKIGDGRPMRLCNGHVIKELM